MYYHSRKIAAVRLRGGKQCFQIQVQGATMEQNEEIAQKGAKLLNQGIPLEEVKAIMKALGQNCAVTV